MPAGNTINYIELPLVDIEGTKRFYGSVFGWEFTDWGPRYISFSGAGVGGGFDGETKPASGDAGVLVVLFADDLESKLDEVVAAGATIARPIFEFPGGRRFQFIDPNGNQLAVWSMLPGE